MFSRSSTRAELIQGARATALLILVGRRRVTRWADHTAEILEGCSHAERIHYALCCHHPNPYYDRVFRLLLREVAS